MNEPTHRTPSSQPPVRGGPAPDLGPLTRRRALARAATAVALGLAAPLSAPLAACATTTRPRSGRAAGRWRHDPLLRPPATPREFRGVWVATVANIDWPTAPTTDPVVLREQVARTVRRCREANLNAILLQVRPACDTIYPSRLEPWSEFLTGLAGLAPEGDFDPLREWIAQAHGAGIELHAWFNPFRARHHEAKTPDAPGHVSHTRPGLVRVYSNLKWLDPGEPESQRHTIAVVADVVRRYDIDGVHFDDYFYPYPVAGREFPDQDTHARLGSHLSRSDWRRACIDAFVRDVGQEIKAIKPGLPLGISPFGIWRPGHPPGVEGLDAFEALAADARRWLREGWLDYASPQLYWKITAPRQPFGHLLDWWHAQNTARRHLWPGLYTSRILQAADPWPASEILQQIELVRAARGSTHGTIQFSARAIAADAGGIASALRDGPFAQPALIPRSPWLPGPRPAQAPNVTAQDGEALTWFTWRAWEDPQAVRAWTVWLRDAAGRWDLRILGPAERTIEVPARGPGAIDAVAIAAVTRAGTEGAPWVMRRAQD